MTPIDVGFEADIVDELQPAVAPTATDTLFLVHATTETTPALQKLSSPDDARTHYPASTALHTAVDTFFGEGGARVYVSKLGSGDLSTVALPRFTADLGPGQVVAPAVVTGPELAAIADWAFTTNRIAVLNGADAITDAALIALKDAVKAGTSKGRFAELEADTAIVPGLAPGTTREVSWAIVKAAQMARSDIATGNPNLAAAGIQDVSDQGGNGLCRYVIGIKDERTDTERQALAAEQINTAKTTYKGVASYGYFTCADLDVYPHWWDVSGSRTMMAARAREAVVAEEFFGGQIDGEGKFLDRYEGGLRGELADLQRLGALYGTPTSPGYRVNVSAEVNPLANLADGRVTSQIVLRTSPHARALSVKLIRRPLTQEV